MNAFTEISTHVFLTLACDFEGQVSPRDPLRRLLRSCSARLPGARGPNTTYGSMYRHVVRECRLGSRCIRCHRNELDFRGRPAHAWSNGRATISCGPHPGRFRDLPKVTRTNNLVRTIVAHCRFADQSPGDILSVEVGMAVGFSVRNSSLRGASLGNSILSGRCSHHACCDTNFAVFHDGWPSRIRSDGSESYKTSSS